MEITQADIEEVLNLKPLKGLPVAAALIAAHVEKIDREKNFRYWAMRGASGRGYRIAVARLENIEYVIAVLEAAKAAQVPAKESSQDAKSARCPFYKSIRRAYAIMREAGLNQRDEAAMRAAFSRFLGRVIESRDALPGGEWLQIGDAIKSRELAW
jgi:pyruvate/2-oxoglutarate dehydrogenase complex dihydrolipoamide acyltransferase (E2) component